MAPNKPEKVFRIGYVSASVFPHEVKTDSGSRTIRSVTVQKRYQDERGVEFIGTTFPLCTGRDSAGLDLHFLILGIDIGVHSKRR